jgi:hypothetical protein
MNGLLEMPHPPRALTRERTAAREHALFRRFPLDGEALLSTGSAPTPYHVYDGHGLFIGGSADLTAATELLAPETVHAVRTEGGRALMGVWIFAFEDASLGPHHELQFSLFVADRELPPIGVHRLALLESMVMRPEMRMLCHGLWNSTPQAVAYNRELLALDARLSRSRIGLDASAASFSVADDATGTPLLEGRIESPYRPSLGANLALMTGLGLHRLFMLAREPWIRMPVMNPVGPALRRNALAESFTKAQRSVLRHFDPARDRLAFGDGRYRTLQFEPQFVQAMDGFKFVYLFPQ